MRAASVSRSKSPVKPLSTRIWGLSKIHSFRSLGPLLLYVLMAFGLLYPYRTNALRPTGDLRIVMSLTLQADHALWQGQFPIRIAPECLGGMDFPAFQFYGNLPYTLTGALSRLLHNPYTAWKIVCLAFLVFGGFFAMRFARWLSGSDRAAVLSGAIFMSAPYLMADLNARGAFAELAAFCLLPAAFYVTIRCLESSRWWRVPWCALAWTAIGLTHNITYLYGVLFAALFCLPFLLTRRGKSRFLRVGTAGVIHAAMMAWYLAPQFHMVNVLEISNLIFNPYTLSPLTHLHVLLAPVLTTTLEGISTPNLGLQVGWPILAGVLLALIGLALRRRTHAPRRLMIGLCLGGFAISFFIVWSPFDFWSHLPKTLWFVQFPYRMLVFVTLFGSGLLACGLARVFPRRVPIWAMLVGLAGIGLAAASYVPRGTAQWTTFVSWLYQHPQIDEMTEYLITAKTMSATSVSDADPANIDWNQRLAQLASQRSNGPIPHVGVPQSQVLYGRTTHVDYTANGPVWLELPVLDYPELLDVQDNGQRIDYSNSGRFLALRLNPGIHRLSIAFVGVRWANIVSLLAWIGVIASLLVWIPRRQLFWRRSSPNTAIATPPAAFPAWESLLGFGVLLLCAGIPNFTPLWHWLNPEPSVHVFATASKSPPENAFDNDPNTAWISAGTAPATLVVEFDRPVTLHGFVLQPRMTGMNECWKRITLRLLNGGQAMYSGSFYFPNAAREPQESISFRAVAADRIEMWFSDPVVTLPDGKHVPADQTNPGYREIQILWGQ